MPRTYLCSGVKVDHGGIQNFTLIRFYLGLNVTHSASDLALTTQFNHLKYYLLDLSKAGNQVKNK